jgi:hypothetical protein
VDRTESFTGARTKKEKDKRKRLRFKVKNQISFCRNGRLRFIEKNRLDKGHWN